MSSTLETVEIVPKKKHNYSIIWMHGLGADGYDFYNLIPELQLPEELGIHFVFPHAKIQPVTINGGMEMRSWYDILEISLNRQVDISGIYDSETEVKKLIQIERDKGIPSENILLAGFSQGGVIALHTGLRFPEKLAGIIALSTYLPTADTLKKEASEQNKQIPIFMAHGTVDPVVSMQNAVDAKQAMETLGYQVQWHEYYMQHQLVLEEIQAIKHFIQSVFK